MPVEISNVMPSKIVKNIIYTCNFYVMELLCYGTAIFISYLAVILFGSNVLKFKHGLPSADLGLYTITQDEINVPQFKL